jgi:hypothetical protein
VDLSSFIPNVAKGKIETTLAKQLKKLGLRFFAEQWILLAPACDAISKLYFLRHIKTYSEPVSPDIDVECHIILTNMRLLPENYELRFLNTPASMYPVSKHHKKKHKTIIYLDKCSLQKYAEQPDKLNQILQEQIITALKRPFISFELLKAVLPFIIAYVVKKLSGKNPDDFVPHPDHISLNTHLNQTTISVILMQLINYAHIERLL